MRAFFFCSVTMAAAAPAQVQTQSVVSRSVYAAAAFSLDGSIAAFSRMNNLTLVDLTTWKPKWNGTTREGSIVGLAISHDGRRLAAAVLGRSYQAERPRSLVNIEIFDAATGHRENITVDSKAEMIADLSFTSDGSLLAVVTHDDNQVVLWDVTRNQMTSLSRPKERPLCTAAFSPNGNMLAWAITTQGMPSREFEIRLFDTVTRSVRGTVARGPSPTRAVALAFSQDGSTLAYAIEDWNRINKQPSQIGLFNIASRKLTGRIKTAEFAVDSLAFSADGRTILGNGLNLSGSDISPDYRVRRMCLWDVATRELKRKFEKEYVAREYWETVVKCVRVPRQDMYLFLSSLGSFSFYDSNSLRLNDAVPVPFPDLEVRINPQIRQDLADKANEVSAQYILALSFDPDDRIVAANNSGLVYSWEVVGRALEGPQLGAKTEGLAITPDARTIAVSRGTDAGIAIVDAVSGKTERELTFPDPGRIRALAYSPHGEWLAAACSNGTIGLWDAQNGHEQATLRGHQGTVAALAFSRDASLLASGGDDRVIRIWDVKSGSLIQTLPHKRKVGAIAFGARNDILASASADDSTVTLWQLGARPGRNTLRGHSGVIRSLAFSPDGSSLAGAGDETVCLWNSSTGKLTRLLAEKFSPGPGRMQSLHQNVTPYTDSMTLGAYSRDGTFMACAGFNNRILLWEVTTRKRPYGMAFPDQRVPPSANSPSPIRGDRSAIGAIDESGFSGAWVLNRNKSEGVVGPARLALTGDLIIRLIGTEVSITDNTAPPAVAEDTLIIDGEMHTRTRYGGEWPYKAEWKEGCLMISESTPNGVQWQRQYKLSADGKILTVIYTITGTNGESVQTRVYDRKKL